jgi:TPR repeat protein
MKAEIVYFCGRITLKNMSKQDANTGETLVDFQQVASKTEQFFEQNRKAISIGMGAIVLVLGGFFAFQFLYKKPREVEASNAAIRADLLVEMDSIRLAVMGDANFEGYEAIAANYSGTKVAARAHFWCGVYYRDIAKDYNTALEHFKQASFGDEAMSVELTGCIGDMYIMSNDLEQGASWLEKAAKQANSSASRDFTGPLYNLKASKVYMELGNNSKAIALLQYVVDNYDKRSQEYGEAEKLLSYLKAKG